MYSVNCNIKAYSLYTESLFILKPVHNESTLGTALASSRFKSSFVHQIWREQLN